MMLTSQQRPSATTITSCLFPHRSHACTSLLFHPRLLVPASCPFSLSHSPIDIDDSPETKAATASALTLRPRSLKARKMARFAAAVVEDDMRVLCRMCMWV